MYIPTSCSHGFLRLQKIDIRYVSGLKHVFGTSNYAFSRGCNLSSLKELSIVGCPLLTSLFPTSVGQTLLLLEMLQIEKCSELKHIVVNEGGDSLEFPQLKHLILAHCPKVQCIFPVSCVRSLVNLKNISIDNVFGLEFIFGPDDYENHTVDQNDIQIVFPFLNEFDLRNAPNLLQILPENFPSRFPGEKFMLNNCPKLTTFSFSNMAGSEQRLWHSDLVRICCLIHYLFDLS